MKMKALLVALFVAGLTASIALADGSPGKEHHGKKGQDAASVSTTDSTSTSTNSKWSEHGRSGTLCRPSVQLEFAGTAASDLGSDGSLSVLVAKGRAGGTSLAGKQLTIMVPSQAKVNGAIANGVLLRVHARACIDFDKMSVTIVAMHVNVGQASKEGDSTESTSTETSTDPTTTDG